VSISFLTFPMARDQAKALDWDLQDSETMMLTILQDVQFFPGYDPMQGEQARPQSSYSLYLGPPLTGVEMFDLLLLEAMQDPTRNARYKLDAEKCAQIVQLLWLSVLPL
jgi:hypothetical protein